MIELLADNGFDFEGRNIFIELGLKAERHVLEWVCPIAAGEVMTKRVVEEKPIGTEVLPLDDMNQFVKMQRFVGRGFRAQGLRGNGAGQGQGSDSEKFG